MGNKTPAKVKILLNDGDLISSISIRKKENNWETTTFNYAFVEDIAAVKKFPFDFKKVN